MEGRTAALTPPQRTTDAVVSWVQAQAAGWVWAFNEMTREILRDAGRSSTDQQDAMIREAKRYARKPLDLKALKVLVHTVPLDLSDWRYAKPPKLPPKLGIILNMTGEAPFGAANWISLGSPKEPPAASLPTVGVIQIFAGTPKLQDLARPQDLKRAMTRLETAIEHEGRHLAQDLLAWAVGHERVGLPPGARERGEAVDPFEEPEKYHLRPHEFHPLVDSMIREFRLKLEDVPPQRRSQALKQLMEDEPMLRTLQERKPEWWRRAVREISKQLMAERVASRYRLAGFIPDKFFKTTKAELQRVFKEPVKEPWDIGRVIHDKIVPIFKRFMEQLITFGMNRHAVDSVQHRLDLRLEMLERIATAWSHFYQASRSYSEQKDAQHETELAIRIAIEEVFEKRIKTVAKGLGEVWVLDPNTITRLAQQVLKKATPEELAAIDAAAHDDWSNTTLNTKYRFFERVKLTSKAWKLVKTDKVKTDWLRWFESIRALLEANYTQEALAQVEGFDDFQLGNLRFIVLDPNVNHFENHAYVKQAAHAQALLRNKGMSKLWYGVIFVEAREFKKLDEPSLKAYRELGYQTLESTAGTYHSGSDVVKLTAPPSKSLVGTIIHEMGHRYWYKFMKPAQRARFNALVQTNPSERTRDFPSGPAEEGVEKPVTPVSTYGKSTIEEAFAEAFAHYVMEKDMNRDQLESFRSVLSTTIEDRVASRYREVAP